MKRIILALAMGSAFAANAQENSLKAGSIAVGGSFGLSSTSGKVETAGNGSTTKVDGDKTTKFNILPSINYFLSDKMAFGFSIGYEMSKTKSPASQGQPEVTNTNSSIPIVPSVSIFQPLAGSEKFGLMVTGSIPLKFGSIKAESKSGSTTTTTKSPMSSFGIAVAPGIYYFPASKFALVAGMGNLISFTRSTVKREGGGVTQKTFTNELEVLNINTLGLNFGGYFFF